METLIPLLAVVFLVLLGLVAFFGATAHEFERWRCCIKCGHFHSNRGNRTLTPPSRISLAAEVCDECKAKE